MNECKELVVRFSGNYWKWWLFDRSKLKVIGNGKFPDGSPYVEVAWICKGEKLSPIANFWNPNNFVLIEK